MFAAIKIDLYFGSKNGARLRSGTLQVILRTVLGAICNSATLSAPRRQPVNFASHPGDSDPWTCAAAESRGVAAAQNSD